MIFDSCANAALYTSVNRYFERAFSYLLTADLPNMAEGRYPIEGDDLYITIMERDLKNPADAALEAHDTYIDIQVVIKGTESFGWKDRNECISPLGEMNAEKDVLFFDDKPSTYFTLSCGQFAIFLPTDAHAPLVGEGHIKKAILKVRV